MSGKSRPQLRITVQHVQKRSQYIAYCNNNLLVDAAAYIKVNDLASGQSGKGQRQTQGRRQGFSGGCYQRSS